MNTDMQSMREIADPEAGPGATLEEIEQAQSKLQQEEANGLG